VVPPPRLRALAVSLILVVALAPAPGSATPMPGFASDNVEHLDTIVLETGFPSSTKLLGKYLYVGGSKSLSIYDVSDPLAPELVSYTPVGFSFPAEDIDTNGETLLIQNETDGPLSGLHVFDVEDKTAPVEVAFVSGLPDHTFECVLDCRWGYGSRGSIVDLRRPAQAEVVSSWGGSPPNDGFDVTEVAPGMILTATRMIRLLDARRNPKSPKVVALGATDDNRLIHSNLWPRRGKDRFFFVQGETPTSHLCDTSSGAFMTWDASSWKKTHTFQMIDEYRFTNGTYNDGNPPVGALGCTVMWFDEHPDFRNGGLVAAAGFEHGTRFLRVDDRGQIGEVGHFTPLGGENVASYWITDEIVYAVDYSRGIDILRFEGS
jgi:hypothetical protein